MVPADPHGYNKHGSASTTVLSWGSRSGRDPRPTRRAGRVRVGRNSSGRPKMRSHRGGWLSPWFLAAAFSACRRSCRAAPRSRDSAPTPSGRTTVSYTPYTSADRSGRAGRRRAGGGVHAPHRGPRANQFQQYLDDLQGGAPGRNVTDRAGIGMPYYRSSVDPLYDPKETRQYEPNRNSNRTFEQAQKRVAERYFAYYSQRDPVKRAELLREYREARRRRSPRRDGPRAVDVACPRQPFIPRARHRSGRRIRGSGTAHRRDGSAGGRHRPFRARPRGPGHRIRPIIRRIAAGEHAHRDPQSVASHGSRQRPPAGPGAGGPRLADPAAGLGHRRRPASRLRVLRPVEEPTEPAARARRGDHGHGPRQAVIGPMTIPSHRRRPARSPAGKSVTR